MNTLIIALLAAAILLFVLSFFQKDRTKQLEQDLEELSLLVIKEQYGMKTRLKVLEEELLLENAGPVVEQASPAETINDILKNQVLALHSQGLNVMQISRQSSLPPETVKTIISARR